MGLKNEDLVTCTNEACDGLLQWDSGKPFFYQSIWGLFEVNGYECFFYDNVQEKVINEQCCHKAQFFCQS